MAEYIEREKFRNILEAKAEMAMGTPKQVFYNTIAMLDLIPAADVVEVRHGEWLDNGDRDSNGVPKPFAISCSACGSSAGTDWMKYCPSCGAYMRGETNG